MTKISKKSAYPIKIPVRKDYFVGSDSENNGKTINFDFESGAKLIGEINGSTALSYRFRTDSNIDLTVLTEGVFLSAENETTIANISKLYINKNNFHETNMSDLFRFVSVNRESFLMKLRNSSNLSNAVYFRITDATEFESYFILDVAVEINNASLPQLTNFNVYFFDFELSSSDLAITLPEFNKIVTQTGYTSTETTITFNPSWTWLIKNVSYTNPSSVTKPITPTSAGKKRIDSFVLNTSGTFQVVTGTETIGSPIQELTPIDTLYVTFCIVGDAGIESVEPIDLSNYATIDYVNAKDALLSDRITTLEEGGSGVGDMVLASPQTVSGLKTFLAGKLGLRNIADTVTSFFTNSNTASRTYTLPDRSGTLADNTDIASINTGKMNTPVGTVNYLSKFLTASTIGLSRLFDDGVFFGIGTVNAPTKDLTLGNQANREIGIEQSNNVTNGRDLKVRAGRAINFIPSPGFLPLNQGALQWQSIVIFPNKDVLVSMGNTDTFYLQAGGIGNFVSIGSGFNTGSMASNSAGDSYLCYNSNIYKRLAGSSYNSSSWISLGLTSRNYSAVACAPNGDVYACVIGGDIYKQTAGIGGFVALGQTSRQWTSLAIAPNGDVYCGGLPEDIYKQTGGVGNFIGQGTYINCYSLTFSNTGDLYVGSNSKIMKAVGGVFPLIQVDSRAISWSEMASNADGSVYALASNQDVYFQSNDNLGSPNLDGGAYKAVAGTGKGTGKSRYEVWTGQKTASGTDMQVETLREYIDENGYHVYTSIPVYADNASAISGGLPIGCEYRTSTGIKMIVF